eukprot:gnl/TRDRNA2_/TRDRNA2_65012_c0_seq1.p1 gnl/TRDRNA2_/TRDRNA2_65012_c0~~gnl/TRDRNA2_/TRDRNA2_65012_c0_seq1.p1  ORF type:complete len:131 (-),score=28.39 gnl/TRDRNA2_/TRDRNA2_65012_c0_seq1:66-458(-)
MPFLRAALFDEGEPSGPVLHEKGSSSRGSSTAARLAEDHDFIAELTASGRAEQAQTTSASLEPTAARKRMVPLPGPWDILSLPRIAAAEAAFAVRPRPVPVNAGDDGCPSEDERLWKKLRTTALNMLADA